MDMKYLTRNVNEGFSGGEKKRNEILQASRGIPALFSVQILLASINADVKSPCARLCQKEPLHGSSCI